MKDSSTGQIKQLAHQTLHGYSKGHRLLASSVDLAEDDADLMLSLSDLSGSLAGRSTFQPYDTFYPLPSQKFFAVGRTFPDDDAPRPGCVLTHTLLIPMNTWKKERCVSYFERHLRMPPSRHDFVRFQNAISCESDDLSNSDLKLEVSEGWLQVFVARFFEKDISPLVVTDFSQASALFWRLVSVSWPNLRSDMSCCTWALEPRFITAKKPFDLMFAPHSAVSKFEFASSHFLDSAARIDSEFSEDWTIEIAKMLSANELPTENNELFNELPKERSSIRKFLFFQNLSSKSITNPRAALGALDILSSLSSSSSDCLDLKQEVAESALRLVEQNQYVQENLETLQILSQKLMAKPLSKTVNVLGPQIRALTERFTVLDADYAVNLLGSTVLGKKRRQVSPFVLGVVEGLLKLGTNQSLELFERLSSILFEMPEIIRELPRIIELYVSMGDVLNRWSARNELASVIPQLDPQTRSIVIDSLLPYAVTTDLHLLSTLVSSGFERDAAMVLEKLDELSFFSDVVRVRSVASLATPHTVAIRRWLESRSAWSDGMFALAARTWKFSEEGLCELLDKERNDYRAHVLLEYLLAAREACNVHEWLVKSSSTTSALLSVLFSIDFEITIEMSNLLSNLFQFVEVRFDNVAQQALLSNKERPQILEVPGVREAVLRGIIVNCIHSDSRDKAVTQELMQTPYISKCLHQVASWKLREWLIVDGPNVRTSAAVLEWLSICPSNFLQDRVSDVLQIVELTVKRSIVGDYQDLSDSWTHLLISAERALSEYQFLRFCGQALKFSFEHVRRPVSKLCVITFYPVYKSVVRKGYRTPAEVDDLFSFYTWDRGKELRKRLVTSFSESIWPAGDLVFAVPDKELRSKIVRRLEGTREGSRYLNKIISDLKKRQGSEELILELRSQSHNSTSDDDWI